MSVWLMLSGLFVKHYLPLGNQYLAELPLYIFIMLLLLHLLLGNKINLNRLTDNRVITFTLISLGLQFVSILLSYKRIGGNSFNLPPIEAYRYFVVFIFFVYLHYYVVGILVSTRSQIELFLKGAFLSTVTILTVTFLQFFYQLLPGSPLNAIMSLMGHLFEARNQYMPQWYISGSYVQTMKRLNGFYTESAMLAAYLSIICLPFILAAIKNKCNIFHVHKEYKPLKYYVMLYSVLIILLLAKTSTGILAILVVLLLFWLSLPFKRKITYGYLFAFLIVIFVFIYNHNAYVYNVVEEYVFGKNDSASTDNRLGNTIGLFITFIHHPILGIGNGYTNYYLLQYTPVWSTNNWEFNDFVTVRHNIPILSIFLGWMAQFGIIVFSLFIVYIIKLQRDLSKLVIKFADTSNYLFYRTIKDSSLLFFLILLPLSFFNFGWSDSSFLILFFFFVVFRQFLKREEMALSNEINTLTNN